MYYVNSDLLAAFQCDNRTSFKYFFFLLKNDYLHVKYHSSAINFIVISLHVVNRYKYKFLRATTSNIPNSVIKENRGSKLSIGRGGMLKVQHLVSIAKPSASHTHVDSAGYQQPGRIAHIEFFLKPEESEE